MPTYDYQCDACDHQFELFQSIKDALKRKCPECGKPKLRRLFGTGAAIMFKGSGFYTTDYRSDSYKKSAKDDASGGESKSGDAKTGDSKTGDSKSSDAKSGGESKTSDSSSKPAASESTGKRKKSKE